MPTNPRIERLTREALGAPAESIRYPKGTFKALVCAGIVLATVGAVASTLSSGPREFSGKRFILSHDD